ncbi:hypothetical protein CVT25_012103 [Psilocybe cyanescens]|uniref:Uncharacterized protein n=1 Tax=Psilocybe cyanescens TaxID=93625 RepID=A0A409VR08_PSICY|nr:hypothetical protein CVT25_012103 [Psilocybe cyanescens]
MLEANNKRFYHAPRFGEAYLATLDEDSYHRELWEEIPALFNNRMTDEEFENFARLDGAVKFEEHASSEELYMPSSELDSTACYFNDEDLFGRLDDDYDYPREVDDEYDAYMGDVYQDVIWIGHEGRDQDSKVILEDTLGDARFFYANDLCDRGDLRDSVVSDQEERGERRAPSDIGSPEMEDVFEEDLPILGQTEPPSVPDKHDESSLQREYEHWKSMPYVRPWVVSRARARSN